MKDFIYLLQNAYSGEKAAALAYYGHWLSAPIEKQEIQKIEQEEWDHRACLGRMLEKLGAKPRITREIMMTAIGCTIFVLCRIGGWLNVLNFGWFMSMYGAGKLEQGNIVEYEVAALKARELGRLEFIEDLIHMAEVEWDHELYFRTKALESKWAAKFSMWEIPPPRNSTRTKLGLQIL